MLASVEALLGVEPRIHASRLALAYSIESGLPVSALDHLAETVAPNDARFKFRLIAKATLERRRKSPTQRLTSDEGDRLARLAKVFSFALDIYKTAEKAREFLTRPHPMLDGKPPLDVALANVGRRASSRDNLVTVPPYALLDLGARYRFRIGRTPATFRMQVANATNTFYWNILGSGSYGLADKRRLLAYLAADF